MFKVFVYSKKKSSKVGIFTHVTQVKDNPKDNTIEIYTDKNEFITFDCKLYKTTIYQN